MTEHPTVVRPDMLGTLTAYCKTCDWRINSMDGDKIRRGRFQHERTVDE